MKKFLSLLLVFVMLFSFCAMIGCGDKEDDKTNDNDNQNNEENNNNEDTNPPADGEITQEMLENSKPGEYVNEKLAAGMEVLVGISAMKLSDETIQQYYQGAQQALIDDGYNALLTDAEGDNVKQFAQIENYLEMGCALICFGVFDVTAYEDFAKRCTDAGVLTCILDCNPEYYVDSIMKVDGRSIGERATEMAIAWLDVVYPDAEDGSIHACIMQFTQGEERRKRTDAMMELLPEDPRVEVTYTNDMCLTVDAGFTGAEEALTYDNEIRLFMTFNADPAVGINNYIQSQPDYDVAEFGVFCTGLGETIQNYIDSQKDDPSANACRGSIGQGSRDPRDADPAPIYYSYYDIMKGTLEGKYADKYVWVEREYAYCYFGYEYDNWADRDI